MHHQGFFSLRVKNIFQSGLNGFQRMCCTSLLLPLAPLLTVALQSSLAIFHDPGAAVNGSINVIDPKVSIGLAGSVCSSIADRDRHLCQRSSLWWVLQDPS